MYAVLEIFLFFCICSFLGWICETLYCSIQQKRFVNRGFLSGPVCPVYGFGALLVLYLLEPFHRNGVLLFLASVLITSLLEYATAVLLEKLFHAKWWDYSDQRFNLHGRVCLLNSVEFGLLGVTLVQVLEPVVGRLLNGLPFEICAMLGLALAGCLTADTIHTVRGVLSLGEKAAQIHALGEELREKSAAYREELAQSIQQRLENLAVYGGSEKFIAHVRQRLESLPRFEGSEEFKTAVCEKLERLTAAVCAADASSVREEAPAHSQRLEELYARIESLLERRRALLGRNSRIHARLLNAFPHMRGLAHGEALDKLREALTRRRRKEREGSERDDLMR